jgi:hypothetical protein
MIIDRFEDGFAQANAIRNLKNRNFAESKAVAAYVLLTIEMPQGSSDLLQESDFSRFMQLVEPDAKQRHISHLFNRLTNLIRLPLATASPCPNLSKELENSVNLIAISLFEMLGKKWPPAQCFFFFFFYSTFWKL